jgi:hypothetical protein
MGTTTRRPIGATPGRIQGISVSCVKLIVSSSTTQLSVTVRDLWCSVLSLFDA